MGTGPGSADLGGPSALVITGGPRLLGVSMGGRTVHHAANATAAANAKPPSAALRFDLDGTLSSSESTCPFERDTATSSFGPNPVSVGWR